MRYVFITMVIAAVMLAGCADDDEGSIEIVFKGVYNGMPLVMFETYEYGFGQDILFSTADMFVSNLRLEKGNGSQSGLSQLELIDLGFTEPADAENGVKLTFRNVPARTYDNLSFGVGVQRDLNAMAPEDFSSSHPLSNAGRYWIPWTSYIFARLEGRLDTLGAGQPDNGLGWLYHTGTDDLYTDLSTSVSVPITSGVTTTVELRLDYSILMGMPDEPIDIASKPINHNPLDTNEIKAIIGNYPKAFSVVVL